MRHCSEWTEEAHQSGEMIHCVTLDLWKDL